MTSSPSANLHFLPPPIHARWEIGHFQLSASPTIRLPEPLDSRVSAELNRLFPQHTISNEGQGEIRLSQVSNLPPEAYILDIEPNGIRIAASSAAGYYYALQTLRQLLQQVQHSELPCLHINDAPTFPFRGYMLDVSRGRVPRIETLKKRIRLLAALKINHLQLYTEHTFEFAFDPDIAAGGDALTAADIRELDDYCHAHFMELTPCLTCFGHMGKILSLPAYRALAEVEFPAASWETATWRQRLRGATLYSRDPSSRNLLERMLEEYLPLFRSARFNLCGDETYDLGKRNPHAMPDELARQYTDHLHTIHSIASRHHKTLMMWGDVLLQHPASISDVPEGAEILDWAYFPSNRFDKCQTFLQQKLPTIVCPSVRGFGTVFNTTSEAQTVMAAYATIGHASGARGMLNTDWGDYGHVNMPPAALHGLAWGAQLAWAPSTAKKTDDFHAAFSRILFQQDGTRPAELYLAAGGIPSLAMWPFPAIHHAPPYPPPDNPTEMGEKPLQWARDFEQMKPTAWVDADDLAQLSLACRFIHFNARVACNDSAASLLNELDQLEKEYTPLWFHESQPSGLLDIHHRGFFPMREYLTAR